MFSNKKVGNYVLTEEIGKGSFGVVYKAYHINNKNNYFAVKIIKSSLINSNSIYEKYLVNEVQIMNSINHKNILHLYDYLQSSNNYYLVMNYCNHGDLESYLKKIDKKYITEIQSIGILRQIKDGFIVLRENKILHRDFKLSNIFINNSNIVIGDFGFAKAGFEMSNTQLGTPLTMAPEIMTYPPKISGKTDLWSIGIVLFQLLFGFPPFFGLSIHELKISIDNNGGDKLNFPKIKNHISEEMKKLLLSLLQPEIDNRIEWDEFLNHSIFNLYNKSEVDKELKKLFDLKYQLSKSSSKNIGSKEEFTDINIILAESKHFEDEELEGKPSKLEISEKESNYEKFSSLIANEENNLSNLNRSKLKKSSELFKTLLQQNNIGSTMINEYNVKSNISLLEIINKLSKDDIYYENYYRVSHELNKIIFLLKISNEILFSKNNYYLLSDTVYEISIYLIQKAYYICHYFYTALVNNDNVLNIVLFNEFKNTKFYKKLIGNFGSLLKKIETFFEESKKMRNKFKNKLFSKMVSEVEDDNNYALLTYNDLEIDSIKKFLDHELKNFTEILTNNDYYKNCDKNILIIYIYSNFSINIESMFPYWVDSKKYNWNFFENNYNSFDSYKLLNLVKCLIDENLKD